MENLDLNLKLYKEEEIFEVEVDIKKSIKELIDIFNLEVIETKGDLEKLVSGIQIDSRKVRQGDIFFAANGYVEKGSKYIPSAIKNGAVAVVIEKDEDINNLEVEENTVVIKVSDVRDALGIMSKAFYNDPTSKMTVIGVTGTKGKSTTTFMTKAILEEAGYTVCLIGGLGSFVGDKKIENNSRTTPDSFDIQRILYKARKLGAEVAIMEVSSQALILKRHIGVNYHITAFTNFGRDHISPNEHPTIEDYFMAKESIVKLAKNNVLNIDDKNVLKVIENLNDHNIITVGIKNDNSDVKVNEDSISIEATNTKFKANILGIPQSFELLIPGKFSVYNAAISIGIAKMLGIDPFISSNALKKVLVEGRLEAVINKLGLNILLDYAHTPDSLENVLKTVKGYTKGRVICAWGVGGNRDSKKRPIMGKISGELADYTILMSDQIRNEDPKKILDEIAVGTKEVTDNFEIFINRKEGIRRAIEIATADDVILIPGFGHDKYQEINGVKYHFDERIIIREIIEDIIKKRNNKF